MRRIRLASKPLRSCEAPRVGETVSDDCTEKLIGRAPNFSWSASDWDVACVKLPVICGLPSEITPCIRGAESTEPSSTNANWSRGLKLVSQYHRVLPEV